ncbi:SulP family inorganic anion transporter [Mycolicibacterium austroafricanum]|uniref:SulP family inorganic anion transporter n=1 Tax=Mycolicibacterium austroafricanum TaxID=39687 RepID=UPI001CA3191D|nr:sulfate permease [Mycolicibacterium austroafricanum]QZT63438.1 sulfate permease [Mycolicibacterium austroafricanum]
MLTQWAPGLAGLREGRGAPLRVDLLAGLSVSAYLIPQALAYAALAGLSPIVGLWAALPPLLIYAILGSSRQLSVGPESTTSLMTAAVLVPLVGGNDPVRYATYAAILAILVGVLCLAAGIIGLGYLAHLLSKPVLVGYLFGIAIAMVTGQLERISGVPVSGESVVEQVRAFASGIGQVHWPTLMLAAAVLLCVVAVERAAPRLPGPLIAVLGAAAVVAVWSLTRYGIDVVGSIPAGAPSPAVPALADVPVQELFVAAVGVAVVAFSDNILTARAFAARVGETVDANAELRALGVSNIAVGFLRGFPVSSSGSRTALAAAAGARTQRYSLVVLVVVSAVVLFGGSVVSTVPAAALGGLIVYAAAKLVDVAGFRALARFRRSELVLALLTTLAVAVFGVLYGVLVAIALTVLDLLRRLSHAHDSVQGLVPGLAGMHDVDDYPDATLIPGLLVYRYDAPLCFANAEDFRLRALEAVDHMNQASPPVRWFVLNAEANVEVDMTAIEALDQLRQECGRRGIVFAMARVKQDLRDALTAAGVIDAIGEDRLYMTLPTAVEAYRAWAASRDMD